MVMLTPSTATSVILKALPSGRSFQSTLTGGAARPEQLREHDDVAVIRAAGGADLEILAGIFAEAGGVVVDDVVSNSFQVFGAFLLRSPRAVAAENEAADLPVRRTLRSGADESADALGEREIFVRQAFDRAFGKPGDEIAGFGNGDGTAGGARLA